MPSTYGGGGLGPVQSPGNMAPSMGGGGQTIGPPGPGPQGKYSTVDPRLCGPPVSVRSDYPALDSVSN